MTCPGLGVNSWISIVKESSYGVNPGSPNDYLRIVSEQMKVDMGKKALPAITGIDPANFAAGNKVVAGDIEPLLLWESCGSFMEGGLGAVDTDSDSPVADAHTHNFSYEETLPSYSIEVSKGNIPAGKIFEYVGCKINQLRFDWNEADVLRLIASIMAKDESANQTASGAPSYASTALSINHFLLDESITTLVGSAGTKCKSGSMLVNNTLGNRFLQGSKLTAEPCRTGKRIISGHLVVEFEDLTAYDAFIDDTAGAFRVKWISESFITGTTPYSLEMNLAGTKLIGDTPVANSEGILETTFGFQNYGIPSSGTSNIKLVNGETAIG